MTRAVPAVIGTAAVILVVAGTVIIQRTADVPRHASAVPHAASKAQESLGTPDPRNTPPPTAAPKPLVPPSVGPYRPKPHDEEPAAPLEISYRGLSKGTKELVHDMDAGVLPAARFVRIALAKMGYLPSVPSRYRGQVTGLDLTVLAQAMTIADSALSTAERNRIDAEIAVYVNGSEVATP